MFSILVIVSAFIAVKSSPVIENENSKDFFVDQVLNTTRNKYITKFEPFPIGDMTFQLRTQTPDGKNHSGFFTCHDVYASGLSYVSRYESCTNGSEVDQFVTYLSYGDNNLKLHSKVHLEFMDLHPNVTAEAVINDLNVNITVGKDKEGMATIMDVMTDGMTEIKVHILGPFGEFDPLVNSLEDEMLRAGNPIVKSYLVKLVTEIYGQVFNEYKYPNN